MNIETASRLIEENLHSIFAWSMSKLYDKSEAEDLAQDIIYATLKSVHRLKDDKAFYGFMWKIADNTLKARLRKKQSETAEFDESFCGVYWITPEDECMKTEEIQLLRRELSLLSNQYREVTVKYYIHGKSCSKISAELNISTEMVKYYLFKTRKILKEGIGMTREFGEKSYDPQTFHMDYWGGGNNSIYWELFKRKLPGNIVLAAYDKPMTITELSIELGVAAVYLEDEIKILEYHDIIKKKGDKYQTNIIIFTSEYERCVLEKSKPIYEKATEIINKKLDSIMPELKKIDFYDNTFDDNCLKWVFVNIAMYHALVKSDEIGRSEFGAYPPLSNGSYGFIFGYDHDCKYHHFNGIYGYYENTEKTAWISIENYRIIEKCQNWKVRNFEKQMLAMTDAVLFLNADENNDQLVSLIDEGFIKSTNNKLSPNFPVFSEVAFEKVKNILTPVINEACNCMINICVIANETLKDYAPKSLKDKYGQLTQIRYQMDTAAFIVETMVKNNQLTIPTNKSNVCMFGVNKI